MNKIIFFIFSLISFSAFCQDELSEYFYPWQTFNYSYEPDGPNNNLISEYKISKHNTLSKKIEVYQGLYGTPIYEIIFDLQVVDSIQAVASTRQIISDYQRRERTQRNDFIYMFVLPMDNATRDWNESQNGSNLVCSSRYVYIKFTYKNEPQYRKAVKITKKFQRDGKDFIQYSYWLKGLSRIASFQVVNSETPTISEIAVELYKNPIIEEVSKEVYEANK